MRFREIMDVVGTAVDTAGVSVIVIGALIATTRFLFQRRGETSILFRLYRQDLGRAILLGLEFHRSRPDRPHPHLSQHVFAARTRWSLALATRPTQSQKSR